MTNNTRRLPLAALIRNEKSSIIYLVIKVEKLEDGDAYYLCRVYNPAQIDQTLDFDYNFIIGDDDSYKYTVLNTRIEENKDGSLYHIISYMHYDEIVDLKNNNDFILRYFTACRFFKKDKQIYSICSVNKDNKTVDIKRKSTWLERLLFKPVFLIFRISWFSLLNSYIPFIPENLDELDYMKTVKTHRYF